jgi:hypothetical protein
MSEPIKLKSSTSPATVEFRRGAADRFGVQVERPELTAAVEVYCIDGFRDPLSLVEFLDGIARDWRGWEGTRNWSALEGEFSLSCRADRLGHIYMTVRLGGQIESEPWSVEFQINTEASQIEPLARAMRRGLVS